MITKVDALLKLKPNAEWTWVGERYDNLNWLDQNQTKPTESEINAKQIELQTEYDNNEYQRKRATEYPSIADQLDYIYHHGIDAWKADMIDPVKNKYPKGSE